MKGMKMFRQGDVLIVSTQKKPGVVLPREAGRVVLAHGERTGHAHAIDSKEAALHELREVTEGVRVLLAFADVDLSHEEHSTIKIPKGIYLVVRQREYDALASRLVAD